jgi:hypothetical protein
MSNSMEDGTLNLCIASYGSNAFINLGVGIYLHLLVIVA